VILDRLILCLHQLSLLGAVVLACRQIWAGAASGPHPAMALALAAGGAAAAAAGRRMIVPGLAAFAAVLEGLKRIGLTWYAPVQLTVFSGVVLAWVANEVLRRRVSSPSDNLRIPRLFSLGFAVAVLVSLVSTMPADAWLNVRLWNQPNFGYGDALYPIDAAFGWLMAALLLHEWVREAHDADASHLTFAVAAWAGGAVMCFVTLQLLAHIPEPYVVSGDVRAPYSPAGDIHALGTLAAWLATLASWHLALGWNRQGMWRWLPIAMAALATAVLSWSRATWLGLVVGLGLLLVRRLSNRARLLVVLGAAGILLLLNIVPIPRGTNAYVDRFLNLVHVRDAMTRERDRIHLWSKAVHMITSAPVLGHGVGRFYVKSPTHADADDPLGANPDFAHNVFLQVAAETGIIGALLFLGMVLTPLLLKCRLGAPRIPESITTQAAAAAYLVLLLTQMTANALAVYPDQQIYFVWACAAALPLIKRVA
jgi:hypothetical protein